MYYRENAKTWVVILNHHIRIGQEMDFWQMETSTPQASIHKFLDGINNITGSQYDRYTLQYTCILKSESIS